MRLIDADALRDELFVDYFDSDDWGFISHHIDDAPTVDAVQVVRCKDCRHRDPEDHKCDSGETERQGCPFKVADDYFCAYGERDE